ncbi:MAG: hypothetical protein EOO02_24595 [Chitinophagaceae bacterium]|nr:MAG: hypothetical protein EOO02_24595 [Chitinophagaceae bacterium]
MLDCDGQIILLLPENKLNISARASLHTVLVPAVELLVNLRSVCSVKFDVKHKLHGLSAGIGLPFLPVGALLISNHLIKNADWQQHRTAMLFSSHATWISLLFMGLSMFLLFSSMKKTGITYGPDSSPFTDLPKGVIGINGWANRVLVLCYIFYPVLMAILFLTINTIKN